MAWTVLSLERNILRWPYPRGPAEVLALCLVCWVAAGKLDSGPVAGDGRVLVGSKLLGAYSDLD